MNPIRRIHLGGQDWPARDVWEATSAACGDQIEWGIAIPWAFTALSVPRSCTVMPAPPQPGDDEHAATAYWCPLMHLLAYSLAWARPYRGLRWWYDAGKPTDDDPRLSVMADLWDADGQLDCFVAWMAARDPDWSAAYHGIADPEHFALSVTARPAVDTAGPRRSATTRTARASRHLWPGEATRCTLASTGRGP